MLLMQGQCRPCQDSICSVRACLWPGATALGDGGELGGPRPVCLQGLPGKPGSGAKCSSTRLRCKEVLIVPVGGVGGSRCPSASRSPRWPLSLRRAGQSGLSAHMLPLPLLLSRGWPWALARSLRRLLARAAGRQLRSTDHSTRHQGGFLCLTRLTGCSSFSCAADISFVRG